MFVFSRMMQMDLYVENNGGKKENVLQWDVLDCSLLVEFSSHVRK